MRRTLVFSVCVFLFFPVSSLAHTWLVRQDGSGDCTTIQACINSASLDDTVLVGPGEYVELVSVYWHVKLLSEGGPAATTIVARAHTAPAVTIPSGSLVDGFTIRDAAIGTTPAGGAEVAGGTIRNCLLINNNSSGIDVPGLAGGVLVYNDGVVEGNTIVKNGLWVTAGGIYCWDGRCRIERNIVALNTYGYGIACGAGPSPVIACNDVWANQGGEYGGECGDRTGTDGNISVDPLFCDPEHGDYRLRSDSPCLNSYGCGQIGAFGVGCGPTPVTETTWGRVKALFR